MCSRESSPQVPPPPFRGPGHCRPWPPARPGAPAAAAPPPHGRCKPHSAARCHLERRLGPGHTAAPQNTRPPKTSRAAAGFCRSRCRTAGRLPCSAAVQMLLPPRRRGGLPTSGSGGKPQVTSWRLLCGRFVFSRNASAKPHATNDPLSVSALLKLMKVPNDRLTLKLIKV